MARRPAAPTPRSSGTGRTGTPTGGRPTPQDREDSGSQDRKDAVPQDRKDTATRTDVRDARTRTPRRDPDPVGPRSAVVAAADRFRGRGGPRPWLRHRRTVIGILVGVLVLLAAVVVLGLTLPQLKVHEVQVQGSGYVSEEAVQEAAEPHLGTSILRVPTDDVARAVEEVPGVRSAEVSRRFPDKVSVKITERAPLAEVRTGSGDTEIIDEDGVRLPEDAASEDTPLVPLTLAKGTKDEDATRTAMLEVLAALPEDLRGTVSDISASTPSDVRLTVEVEPEDDGGEPRTKTVVWGDAGDSALKAQVTATLLGQPGKTVDVSSPVAPITR